MKSIRFPWCINGSKHKISKNTPKQQKIKQKSFDIKQQTAYPLEILLPLFFKPEPNF